MRKSAYFGTGSRPEVAARLLAGSPPRETQTRIFGILLSGREQGRKLAILSLLMPAERSPKPSTTDEA
jgi:hypothetical protein